MTDFQQIKIKIADKEYMLKIQPHQEALLRRASKVLNERIKNLQKKSRIMDRQDLLAMVAFDATVESLKLSEATEQNQKQVTEMEQILDSHLPK
ncbi:MAG: cell division protein ZapA [Arenicella sp.]|jgi:cell division protein ZapA